MSHRVRTLIGHLEYGALRKQNILPKKPMFTGIKKGGNLPGNAKKIGYAQFGMFLDHFIQKVLALIHGLEYEHKHTPAYDLYTHCNRYYFQKSPAIEKKVFHKDKDFYREIAEFVTSAFSTAEKIELEPEWTVGHISGHPDLVIDNIVYDIKTTGQFNSMRIPTIFQLLAYYCLAQQLNKQVTGIGLVLPAQRTILSVELKGWKWEGFWTALNACIETKIRLQPSPEYALLFASTVMPYVGSHVAKESTISKTLQGLSTSRPWQIFFGGRCNTNFKVSDRDIATTLALTTNKGYRFYVHAPYTINVSRKYDDDWVVKSLGKHLSNGVAMGSKGIVVHCGVKAKQVEYKVAYENMVQSVIRAAEYATPECPLLIETSAGETGELLSKPEELISFYHSLPDETKANTKICVDTCHVFAAGYCPQDFVRELDEAKVPIGLFHFNDSKGEKGCCMDRHAHLGTGYVGLPNLIAVGTYALQNKIDMVFE
jgi:deoxyribonuclease-4